MRFWFHVESPDFASNSDSVVAVQDKNVSTRLELDVRVWMSVPDGGDQLEGGSAPDEEVPSGGEADDQLGREHDGFHLVMRVRRTVIMMRMTKTMMMRMENMMMITMAFSPPPLARWAESDPKRPRSSLWSGRPPGQPC